MTHLICIGRHKSSVNKPNWCSWNGVIGYVLMFRQQLCTGDVKDSNGPGVEATGENLLAGMKGHRGGALFWLKVIQLHSKDSSQHIQHKKNPTKQAKCNEMQCTAQSKVCDRRISDFNYWPEHWIVKELLHFSVFLNDDQFMARMNYPSWLGPINKEQSNPYSVDALLTCCKESMLQMRTVPSEEAVARCWRMPSTQKLRTVSVCDLISVL